MGVGVPPATRKPPSTESAAATGSSNKGGARSNTTWCSGDAATATTDVFYD
jgi:hypothetical protein